MSKWIDADDVANAIYHHFPSIRTMADARGVIEEAPSIDIVRCKECVDFVYDEQYKCYGCATDNGLMGEIKPNDFCSRGERKESE